MNKTVKYIIFVIIVLAVAVSAYEVGIHKNPKTVAPTSSTKQQTKSSASYFVGDTQTDGNINITLDSTGTATTMEQIPANETIFSVDITVVNKGTTTFESKDAFVGLSSVYTQIGTDTSTGKYNPAYSTPCFGGGDVSIAPGQSSKGCIQFMVPKNALVDTYFYDKLKWYL